jgi:hypothetical protein
MIKPLLAWLGARMQPVPDPAPWPQRLDPITEQFEAAHREARRRGWIVEHMSLDAQGLHVQFRIPDSQVRYMEPLGERAVRLITGEAHG